MSFIPDSRIIQTKGPFEMFAVNETYCKYKKQYSQQKDLTENGSFSPRQIISTVMSSFVFPVLSLSKHVLDRFITMENCYNG